MTLPVVLAIAGCFALLIALFGGGVKAKEVEVPIISVWQRIVSGLVGAVLIGIALWASFYTPPTSQPPSPQPSETPTPIASPVLPTLPSATSPLIIQATVTSAPSSTPIPTSILTVNQAHNTSGFCVVQVQDNPPFGLVYYLSKYNIPFDSVEVYYRCDLDSARKSCLKESPLDKVSGHFVVAYGDYLVMPSVQQEACTQPDSLWVTNAIGQ